MFIVVPFSLVHEQGGVLQRHTTQTAVRERRDSNGGGAIEWRYLKNYARYTDGLGALPSK